MARRRHRHNGGAGRRPHLHRVQPLAARPNWTVAIGIPRRACRHRRVWRSLATLRHRHLLLSIVLGALGGALHRPQHRAPDGRAGRGRARRSAGASRSRGPRRRYRRDPRRSADSLARRRRRARARRGRARGAPAPRARRRAPSPRSREPLEGRVPRDARPRAAQSARRDRQCAASSCEPASEETRGARARRHRAPGAAPRAHDRRPARRGARHDRQDRAAAPAARARRGGVARAVHACARTRPRRQAGASCQQAQPVWVDADPTRIEQIVGNLLGNALKFTPDGGRITSSVAREGERGGRCASRDTGVGMSPELVDARLRAFRAGRPRRSTARKAASASASRWCGGSRELHGGSVEGESDGAGRGQRRSRCACRRSSRRRRRTRRARRRRAVAAARCADRRGQRRRARDAAPLLELDGHRVRVAEDGVRGARARVRAALPEIALIDIGLPRMDGYELARRIRAASTAHAASISSPSRATDLPEDRARTREAGFDVHLVKPVDAADLAAVLAKR